MIVKDWFVRGNSKFYSNVTASFEKEKDGIHRGYLSFNSNTTLEKLKFLISVTMAENDKYDCKNKFFERIINLCKYNIEVLRNNLVTKWLVQGFLDNMNFHLECPMKAGFYEVKKSEFVLPPSSFKLWNGFYCLKLAFFGKTAKSKIFEDTFAIGGRANLKF